MSLSPESRAIIDMARDGEDMNGPRRARMRQRVMAQVLTGAAVTATTAHVASAATVSLAAKLGITLVVGSALGWGAHEMIEPAPLPAFGGSSYIVERATEAVRSAPSQGSSSPALEETVPAPTASATSTPPRASADRSLADEMALLQEAQRELQANNAERALSLLQQHERRYATGALSEEREAARVLALCRMGRVEEARAAATRFAARFPRSPHGTRVLAACAER